MNFIQTQFLKVLRDAPEDVVMMSKRDCHMIGLDSIVISQKETGELTRAFFAHENHKLYDNQYCHTRKTKILGLGVHDHKYDLTLTGLSGFAWNLRYTLAEVYKPLMHNKMQSYKFSSGLNGNLEVTPLGEVNLELQRCKKITQLFIPSRSLHTVEVTKGKRASWIVEEGETIKDTTTLITHLDQDEITSNGLYKNFTSKQEIINMVEEFFVGE